MPDGVQPPIQDEEGTITQDGNVELHEVKSSDGVDASGQSVSWLLDQQQSIAQDDSVREGEKTADNKDTIEAAVDKEVKKEIQEAGAASVPNEAEERRGICGTKPRHYIKRRRTQLLLHR